MKLNEPEGRILKGSRSSWQLAKHAKPFPTLGFNEREPFTVFVLFFSKREQGHNFCVRVIPSGEKPGVEGMTYTRRVQVSTKGPSYS